MLFTNFLLKIVYVGSTLVFCCCSSTTQIYCCTCSWLVEENERIQSLKSCFCLIKKEKFYLNNCKLYYLCSWLFDIKSTYVCGIVVILCEIKHILVSIIKTYWTSLHLQSLFLTVIMISLLFPYFITNYNSSHRWWKN